MIVISNVSYSPAAKPRLPAALENALDIFGMCGISSISPSLLQTVDSGYRNDQAAALIKVEDQVMQAASLLFWLTSLGLKRTRQQAQVPAEALLVFRVGELRIHNLLQGLSREHAL